MDPIDRPQGGREPTLPKDESVPEAASPAKKRVGDMARGSLPEPTLPGAVPHAPIAPVRVSPGPPQREVTLDGIEGGWGNFKAIYDRLRNNDKPLSAETTAIFKDEFELFWKKCKESPGTTLADAEKIKFIAKKLGIKEIVHEIRALTLDYEADVAEARRADSIERESIFEPVSPSKELVFNVVKRLLPEPSLTEAASRDDFQNKLNDFWDNPDSLKGLSQNEILDVVKKIQSIANMVGLEEISDELEEIVDEIVEHLSNISTEFSEASSGDEASSTSFQTPPDEESSPASNPARISPPPSALPAAKSPQAAKASRFEYEEKSKALSIDPLLVKFNQNFDKLYELLTTTPEFIDQNTFNKHSLDCITMHMKYRNNLTFDLAMKIGAIAQSLLRISQINEYKSPDHIRELKKVKAATSLWLDL